MDIVRQSLAITLVFALLWAALWFLRKKGALRGGFPLRAGFGRGRARRGPLELRAKLALSAQHSVHLVRIGERELVLALHPCGVTLLSTIEPVAFGAPVNRAIVHSNRHSAGEA
jgi:flagellar biogenesis protein FliO